MKIKCNLKNINIFLLSVQKDNLYNTIKLININEQAPWPNSLKLVFLSILSLSESATVQIQLGRRKLLSNVRPFI